MVKHTQAICCQIANELFECVWPFCGVGTSRVKNAGILENQTKQWIKICSNNDRII